MLQAAAKSATALSFLCGMGILDSLLDVLRSDRASLSSPVFPLLGNTRVGRKTMNEKRICGWCGQFKEVYAYQEETYDEDLKQLSEAELWTSVPKSKLKEGDTVGIPQCKECYRESRGELE